MSEFRLFHLYPMSSLLLLFRRRLFKVVYAGLFALTARADFEPKGFYVDYAFNVPTDIMTEHSRAIVHPNAQVDLATATAAGTTVYAYISVGELGANAPHRQVALDLGLPLRGKNTIWNSDLLDLTTGEWAAFLVDNVAQAAVQKGFRGFFLDTLDSVELDATPTEVAEQRAGLVALIKRLHETFPSRSIIVNRGFATLPELVGIADGLLIESVYAAYDFEGKLYRPTAAAETAELEAIMENAVSSGFEVYVLDYADPRDPEAALAVAQRILDAGYHAFVSTPALDGVVLGPWQSVTPAIVAEPLGLTLRPGQDLGLRVLAVGAPEPAYVWFRDDVMVSSATGHRLLIEKAGVSDAGVYRIEVSNRFGSVSSNSVEVVVNETADRGRLTNLSTRAWATKGVAQLIPGVVSSGRVELLARAVGPTLTEFQLNDVASDPGLAVVRLNFPRVANDDWQDGGRGDEIRMAAAAVGAFALQEASTDAALIFDLEGAATLPVDTGEGEAGAALVELYEIPGSRTTGRLINLSVRTNIRYGGETIVVGFVLGGVAASQLLIRAVGPELSTFGLAGVLADPSRSFFWDDELLAQNDNGGTSVLASLTRDKGALVEAFPLEENSRYAAVVLTLPPGT